MRLLLFVLIISMCSVLAVAQPIEWPVSEGGNGHWYLPVDLPDSDPIVAGDGSIAAAGHVFLGYPGHLVTLTSPEENQWVLGLVQDFSPEFCWLMGAVLPEGNTIPGVGWEWVTGEVWDYTNWQSGTLWSPETETISCFSMYPNEEGQWNAARPDTYAYGYIVEWSLETVGVRQATWSTVKAHYR